VAVSVVGTPLRTGFSTSRSPATGNVATAGTLQAGDIIATWGRAGTAAATATVPSGWVNPLGGNTLAASGGCAVIALYHVVTSAEASANTVAWTLTNLWDAAQTGAMYTAALRGVDQVTVVDAFGSAVSGSSVTPHVLAGLLAADVSFSGDMILSGIGADTTTTYSTAPTGWTIRASNAGGQNAGALLSRDTNTTAGVAVAATNITPGGAANYSSITLAFSPVQGAAANQSAFFALF